MCDEQSEPRVLALVSSLKRPRLGTCASRPGAPARAPDEPHRTAATGRTGTRHSSLAGPSALCRVPSARRSHADADARRHALGHRHAHALGLSSPVPAQPNSQFESPGPPGALHRLASARLSASHTATVCSLQHPILRRFLRHHVQPNVRETAPRRCPSGRTSSAKRSRLFRPSRADRSLIARMSLVRAWS